MSVRLARCLPIGVVLLASAYSSSAADPAPPTRPEWLAALIEEWEARPPAHPPLAVYRSRYGGQVVYYVPPGCCDAPGTLYDADGGHRCAPDGGFTGLGDGRCPDFAATRTGEALIWRDRR